jgi:hypothetical protein
MADVNLAELQAEYMAAHMALLIGALKAVLQNQTHEPSEDEQPDPRNQGVKTGGNNSGIFNPRRD